MAATDIVLRGPSTVYDIVLSTAASGRNQKICIGEAWKDVVEMKVCIGEAWKDIGDTDLVISAAWKESN